MVWLSRKYFTDSKSLRAPSRKLGVQKLGPFRVEKLVGRNAVQINLPKRSRAHNVVHVEHTARVHQQPVDLQAIDAPPTQTLQLVDQNPEFVVKAVLGHRRKGRGYQWLTLMEGDSEEDAEWQPTSDFIDSDGTVTEKLLEYVKNHNLSIPRITVVADDNSLEEDIVKQAKTVN